MAKEGGGWVSEISFHGFRFVFIPATAVDDTVGPICVSAVAEIDETDGKVQYRGIVWLRTGKTQIIIHTDSKKAKKNPPLAAILGTSSVVFM